MFEKSNNLEIFFDEPNRSFGIREYSRMMKISSSTAKTYLENLEKEGLLKSKREHNLVLFKANDLNEEFISLKIENNLRKIKRTGIIEYLLRYNPSSIILFGSTSKGTDNKDSDLDIAMIIPTQKEINLEEFEKKLKKKIQLFTFTKNNFSKQKELANNILNGRILYGFIEVY